MRIDLTQMQVAAVAAMLADDDDEQLKLDTLEGETNLFELTRFLLNKNEEDEGMVADLNEQISNRQARKQSISRRVEKRREAMKAFLECARLDKLTLPEATLSLRQMAPKPIVTDEAAIPDDFCTFTRKPNMAAIKEADALPPGVALDNGGVSLTIRRK